MPTLRHRPTVYTFANDADWLNARSKPGVIGASEVPIILGLASYCSPLRLFYQRTGALEFEETERMLIGRCMEHGHGVLFRKQRPEYGVMPARDWYVDSAPEDSSFTLAHPNIDWLRATPDFYLVGQDGDDALLQTKNCDRFLLDKWSEDKCPEDVHAQVQFELHVSGMNEAWASAVIGGNQRKEHRVTYDPTWISEALPKIEAFRQCLLTGNPPDPRDDDVDTLKERYPDAAPDKSIELAPGLIVAYKEANDRAKAAEKEANALKAQIMAAMGDAARCGTIDGVPAVTWGIENAAKMQKVGTYQRRTLRFKK